MTEIVMNLQMSDRAVAPAQGGRLPQLPQLPQTIKKIAIYGVVALTNHCIALSRTSSRLDDVGRISLHLNMFSLALSILTSTPIPKPAKIATVVGAVAAVVFNAPQVSMGYLGLQAADIILITLGDKIFG